MKASDSLFTKFEKEENVPPAGESGLVQIRVTSVEMVAELLAAVHTARGEDWPEAAYSDTIAFPHRRVVGQAACVNRDPLPLPVNLERGVEHPHVRKGDRVDVGRFWSELRLVL